MELPHIISAKDFTRQQLDALFARATWIKKFLTENQGWINGRYISSSLPPKLFGATMELFFDQPSLRTRKSYAYAMRALGGYCDWSDNASRTSSIAKGESLEDTIEMLSGNAGVSVIVLRHPDPGAAKRAAKVSSVPVINAGDGTEHPTQALVDLFTIQEALGSIDGKRITLVGDLHARTAKSLLYALTLYAGLVSRGVYPPSLSPDQETSKYMYNKLFTFIGITPLEAMTSYSDVLYVLRPQQENWRRDIKNPKSRQKKIREDLVDYYRHYTINKRILAQMPENSIVLHPRPRGPELPIEVDSDPRVRHTTQGRNGGPVRIALLEMMHSGEWQKLSTK